MNRIRARWWMDARWQDKLSVLLLVLLFSVARLIDSDSDFSKSDSNGPKYQQNCSQKRYLNGQPDRQWRSSSFQYVDSCLILILEWEYNGVS